MICVSNIISSQKKKLAVPPMHHGLRASFHHIYLRIVNVNCPESIFFWIKRRIPILKMERV